MNQQQSMARADDEIDLAAVLNTLIRRKWWLLIVFCATVSVAAAYLLSAKPIYEADASVYVGEIGEKPLEQTNLLVGRMESTFGRAERGYRASSWLSKIRPKRGDERLIEIAVRAPKADDAQALASKIVNGIVDAHDKLLHAHTRPIEEELAQLEKIAAVGGAALTEAGRKRISLSDSQLTAMMYSVVELGNTHKRIGALRDKLGNISPTQVARKPSLPTSPASPKTNLLLALALFAGLLLGILAAFVAEGLSGVGGEKSSRQ